MVFSQVVSRRSATTVASKRGLSTLIPPRVATPRAVQAKEEPRYRRIERLYGSLPKGEVPLPKPKGFLDWYQQRYMSSGRESIMPLVHILGLMLVVGYSQEYYFHLRHHKNNAH